MVNRRDTNPRPALIGVAALSLVILIATALATTAGARPTRHRRRPAVGLACLRGTWVSEGITTPAFRGGACTTLRITLVSHRGKAAYGIADADYDPSDPLYLTGAGGGYFKLTGAAFGRFEYLGHGHFRFNAGLSDEEVTVFADGKAILTTDVKAGGGFADISCSGSRFTTTVEIPTGRGTARAVEHWRRR
jgi:hypothetical protein